jgi:hypothetical protein
MDRTPDRHAVVRPSSAVRSEAEVIAAKQRTQLANGKATLLEGKDERSLYVRRLKELCAEYAHDLGGPDALSTAQRALIRRAAVMQIELEKLDTRFAEDVTVGERTLELYGRTVGNLRRTLETLGIKRVEAPPKTIAGHLASKRAKP